MMQARLPPTEAERLKALQQYDVLDSAPEQAFDDLAHLAAHICGTPISTITLVDRERQWFKSSVGLAITETPREFSFCAHTILGKELLLVPDTTADERFADIPFATLDRHIRFYAGVPLLTPEGHAIGALCVLDTVPRQLDQSQQDALQRLGRQAVVLLEARRAARLAAAPEARSDTPHATTEKPQKCQTHNMQVERRLHARVTSANHRSTETLQDSEVRYRRLFEAALDGILIVDATTGQIEDVNPYLCRLLGYTERDFLGRQLWEIAAFRDVIANRDAFHALQVSDYIRYNNLSLESRDGQSVAVEFVSNVYMSAGKKVVQCNIRDISEHKLALAALRANHNLLQAIIEGTTDVVFVRDLQGRYLLINSAGARLLNLAVDEVVGKTQSELFPLETVRTFDEEDRQVLEAGNTLTREETGVMGGVEQTFLTNKGILRDEHGNPAGIIGIARDISERKRAEAALKASEFRYHSLFENMLEGYAYCQTHFEHNQLRDFTYLEVNSAFDELTGLKDVVGKKVSEVIPGLLEASPDLFEVYGRVALTGKPEKFETYLKPLGIWFAVAVYSHDKDHFVAIFDNITERKQAEAMLLESRERLALATESAQIGIWDWDVVANKLVWDEQMYALYGIALQDFGGAYETWQNGLHPDDRERGHAEMQAALAGHQEFHPQFRVVWPTGEVRHIEAHAVVKRADDGSPLHVIGVNWDITERKQAEEAQAQLALELQQQRQRLDDILASIPGVVWEAWGEPNAAGQHMGYVSDYVETMLGYSVEEWLATPNFWLSIVHPDDKEKAAQRSEAQFRGGLSRADSKQFRWIAKDGRILWAEAQSVPIYDEHGNPIGMRGVTMDVTERKQAEAQLQFQKTLLEAQTEASRDGILAVSNEGKVLSYNQRYLQMWNIPPQVAASADNALFRQAVIDQIVGPQQVFERVDELYKQPDVQSHEEILLHDGRIFDRYSAPITNAAGFSYGRVWYFRDITEAKRAENTLRASEERFQSIVANVPGMVYQAVTQPDGSTTWPFIGRGCQEIFEVEPEIMEDNPSWLLDHIHPDDHSEFDRSVKFSVQTLQPREWEGRLRLPSGKVKWIQVTSRPQPLPDGGMLWNSLVMDISARKKAEEERDRFFTMSLDMLGIAGMDGYFKRLNPAFSEILGYTEAELLARPFLELVHPDDRDATLAAVEKLSEGNAVIGFENRYRTKDGSWRWIEWKSASDPEAGLIYAGARDVTERRNTEATLYRTNEELERRVKERTAEIQRANELLHVEVVERKNALDALHQAAETVRNTQNMLQLVMHHIPQAIFWKDRNSVYLGVNSRLAADGGFGSPEDIKGKTDFDMPWAEYAADYQADDRQVMETDTPKLNVEEIIVKADGTPGWFRTNKIPLHDDNHNVVGVLCSYEDITEQKQVEAAIIEARQEAERANLAKSEFLSRMSHELRTPLNAILGFGQILNKQELTELQMESVGHILKGGHHLLNLVNEVLDIARVEAGHLELSLEPVALDDIITEVCALMRPLATERNIGLSQNTAEVGSSHVLADCQRLKQVLINLVANAIKYNCDGGEVEIVCVQDRAGRTSPEDWTSIIVRDTGPGISPEDMPKLFTPFERLNAMNSDIEGTGLGLVLSQRLVMAMGGTLSAQSTVGQGSTFTVELPPAPSPAEQLTNLPPDQGSLNAGESSGRTYTVLCIEDNPSNLLLMESIFEYRPGITLLTAIQGSIGLDLARRHEPDLILLDLNLPDLHGREVLSRLQQSALTRDIPVVVVSADATPTQVERLLTAGARAYLTKPLDLDRVLHTVDKFLPVTQSITMLADQERKSYDV